jgi:NACHT domain-containing protein
LVIAGYSGADAALAELIGQALPSHATSIYWCNPDPPSPDAPLYAAVRSRAHFAPVDFDELLARVARPVLERPSLLRTRPTYVQCLFDWRIEYCNNEYRQAYGERGGREVTKLFVHRPLIEERLNEFLLQDRPLAIITGPSGFGKTTLGLKLQARWANDSSRRVMLIRARALNGNSEIQDYVAAQLGGLGAREFFSFLHLHEWLVEKGQRLLLYVDALNEFDANVERCAELLRNIVRLCYFLPAGQRVLKIIATIRQETWNTMVSHLDTIQLRQALWVDGSSPQSLATIPCGAFTDEELSDALRRLETYDHKYIDINRLGPTLAARLRDPYLLSLVAEESTGLEQIPLAAIYRRAFEEKLQKKRGSFIDVATLKDGLAHVALVCMKTRQDRFRELDVVPAAIRGEVIRLMKDLNIFVEVEDGFLRFDHDRTHEYFLALAMMNRGEPPLDTLDDLLSFLKDLGRQSKAEAAARLYYQLAPQAHMELLDSALELLDTRPTSHTSPDRELLFRFAREVLIEMAEQGEPVAIQYVADTIGAASTRGRVGPQHLRTIVHAAASLPAEAAVSLLRQVSQSTDGLAATEADIYATDKLVARLFATGCPIVDIFTDAPYAAYFADGSLPLWKRMGRLLGFMSQSGPDNSNSAEYAAITQTIDQALDKLLRHPWREEDVLSATEHFLRNCDRLLFNATPQGMRRFFGNPRRREFMGVLKRLSDGTPLSDQDFELLEPFTRSLESDIEYHLGHAFFVLSSLNDLDATLLLAERRFDSCGNNTAPEAIDFLEAVIVYLHILHDRPYDEQRFGRWEETILESWPDVLMYRPGEVRGERRGFHDPFDRVFEDGFGVLYPYGVLSPAARRKSMGHEEYQRDLERKNYQPLPMYVRYLHAFLERGQIEEALQILHALSGVIVLWPMEGLLALRAAIGHSHPRIKRAMTRILAEAYSRHPAITMRFLRVSGALITDDELLEIKIRQDARIGRRQVDEEQWARIGRHLLRRPATRTRFIAALRALLEAPDFYTAFAEIVHAVGLTQR